MTSSRLGRFGVPIGIGAAVLALVLATLVERGGNGRPARLPIGLAAAGDAKTTSGEQAGAPAAAGDRAMYGGTVTYRFAAGTLEGLATEGRAYKLSTGRAERADVERLAAALGLDAEPTHVEEAWVVREGSRELRVADAPGNPWYFSPYAVSCVSSGSTGSGSGTATSGDSATSSETATSSDMDVRCEKPLPPEPAPPPPSDPNPNSTPAPEEKPTVVCEAPPPPDSGQTATPCTDEPRPADQPADQPADTPTSGGGAGSTGSSGSGVACGCPEGVKCACAEPSPIALGPESEARAKATEVLRASGHDDVTLRVDRGYDAWYVSGDVAVGGMRTIGFGVHVGIDADGHVRDASGWLGGASGADTYPLLDPEAAAKRNPWGAAVRPMMACDAMTPECEQPQEVVREVTKVELGLLFAPVLSGDQSSAYLVPAWIFTTEDNPTYPEAVLALPDEYIAEPQPVDGGCNAKDACDQPVSVDGAEPAVAPAAPRPEPAKS